MGGVQSRKQNGLLKYWNKIRRGCIWIFDDTNWPTTHRARELLLSKGYTEIFKYDLNGIEWKVFKRD